MPSGFAMKVSKWNSYAKQYFIFIFYLNCDHECLVNEYKSQCSDDFFKSPTASYNFFCLFGVGMLVLLIPRHWKFRHSHVYNKFHSYDSLIMKWLFTVEICIRIEVQLIFTCLCWLFMPQDAQTFEISKTREDRAGWRRSNYWSSVRIWRSGISRHIGTLWQGQAVNCIEIRFTACLAIDKTHLRLQLLQQTSYPWIELFRNTWHFL